MRAPLIVLALLAACAPAGVEQHTLEVFAASSLTEAMMDLERGFEAEHPGVDVRVSCAGSQVLRMQIEQGARVDVFASADEAHMVALRASGEVAQSSVLARNELALITPLDGELARFDDLPSADRVVLGGGQVQVGRYARELLRRAGRRQRGFAEAVARRVVSEEPNVRLVRAKVALGEADAAFVYRTDVSPDVRTVAIPPELNVRASYPIAVTTRAERPTLGREFVAWTLGPRGQELLRARGFLPAGS